MEVGDPIPDEPDVQFIEVTPSLAEYWLTFNPDNRPVRKRLVQEYANFMEEGEWMVSPDCIAFSWEQELVNGQHRLRAIVLSGETQEHGVMFGLHPDVFKKTDVGAKRSPSDVLSIEGYDHSKRLSALTHIIRLYERGQISQSGRYSLTTNSEISEAASRYTPRAFESIEYANEFESDLSGFFPISLVTFCHFVYTPEHPEKTDEFVRRFSTGIGIEDWGDDTSPVKMIRDRIHEIQTQPGQLTRRERLAVLIKAINSFVHEEPVRSVSYSKNADRYPAPAIDPEEIPELEMETSYDWADTAL